MIANQLSRGRQIQKMTELSLNQDEVQRLFRVYSTLNIDLLATKENENYQSFNCSPFQDHLAWRCDGLVVEECLHMQFRCQYCFRRSTKQWTKNIVFSSLFLNFHSLSDGNTSNNELVIAKNEEFIHEMW